MKGIPFRSTERKERKETSPVPARNKSESLMSISMVVAPTNIHAEDKERYGVCARRCRLDVGLGRIWIGASPTIGQRVASMHTVHALILSSSIYSHAGVSEPGVAVVAGRVPLSLLRAMAKPSRSSHAFVPNPPGSWPYGLTSSGSKPSMWRRLRTSSTSRCTSSQPASAAP